jgi:hypothetical protein
MQANPVVHRADGISELTVIHKDVCLVCLIDTSDYETIKPYRWYAHKSNHSRTFYAHASIRRDNRSTTLLMHRLLLPDVAHPDHKDGNGLNNCRNNLRQSTRSQNGANRRKKRNATSKYLGVYFDRQKSKFRAGITINGKSHGLGHFLSEKDAARAYDIAALKHHGAFARLNFPTSQQSVELKPSLIQTLSTPQSEVA